MARIRDKPELSQDCCTMAYELFGPLGTGRPVSLRARNHRHDGKPEANQHRQSHQTGPQATSRPCSGTGTGKPTPPQLLNSQSTCCQRNLLGIRQGASVIVNLSTRGYPNGRYGENVS